MTAKFSNARGIFAMNKMKKERLPDGGLSFSFMTGCSKNLFP